MLRENLVGAIITLDSPIDGHSPEWIFVEFTGEGAESVVYTIAPLDDPSKRDLVLKFSKDMPMFEMETLHHGLRLHEELYPDHPLRMSAERRLEMLKAEMLGKIDYGHLVFRVSLYRELIDKTIIVLATTCSEAFGRGEPLGPMLDESPTRGMLDDNLAQHLDAMLDDDLIVEEYRPFFEQLREDIPPTIARWQAEHSYAPLSRNPLVNLLGLYAEGFINVSELQYISSSPEFAGRMRPLHAEGLFDLISTLYFHLKGRLEGGDKRVRERAARHVDVASIGCDLLRDADNGRLIGLSQLWKARILMLREWEPREVDALLRAALDNFQEPANLGERHDTLMLLSALYANHAELSARLRSEAEGIRRRLGIEDG